MVLGVAGLTAAVILGALAPPMWRAYGCYADWGAGERGEALVVSAGHETGPVLQWDDGGVCTAPAGAATADEFEAGERVAAVRRADRPGICELAVTVDVSRGLLVAVAAGTFCLLLFVVLMASVVLRSLTRVPQLTTHLHLASGAPACPRCAKSMEEGYLPLKNGIHWRGRGAPVGAAGPFGGLQGTLSILKPPRVHAFRCEPCEVVTFRYGKPAQPVGAASERRSEARDPRSEDPRPR